MGGMNLGSMIAGAAQGTMAIGQFMGGLLMKKGKRPVYQPPKALTDSIRRAEAEESAIADPMLAAAQNKISQNTANTLSAQQKATRSSSQLLNAASQAQVVENNGMSNLAVQGMGIREQRRNRRYNLASVMGSVQDRMWQINQMEPYQGRAAAKRALMGAGMQNFMKSSETFGAGASSGPASSGVATPDTTAASSQMYNQMGVYNQANLYSNPNQYANLG
ncbi:hypothetical protein D770_15005 [Flammeovirgaceae bacterium 311]|nr:hypothetical protein D770_15005 [Flammeovirgaceae bacterium 311]